MSYRFKVYAVIAVILAIAGAQQPAQSSEPATTPKPAAAAPAVCPASSGQGNNHGHGTQFKLVKRGEKDPQVHEAIKIHGQIDNILWCSDTVEFRVVKYIDGRDISGQQRACNDPNPFAGPNLPTNYAFIHPSGVPKKESEGCEYSYVIQFKGDPDPQDPHIQFLCETC